MADATYNNQSVYLKQGADELVVADGGLITVESGGGIDIETGATYSIESGGKIEVESGGEVELQSGGFFDLQSGGQVRLTSSSYTLTADQLKALLWNQVQFSVIANSAGVGSGVLSVVNLPSAGYIIFSIGDGASNASAWLTSTTGTPGQVMVLMMRGAGSTGSIWIQFSGVSVTGIMSGNLSAISLYNSNLYAIGASTGVALLSAMGYVKLLLTGATEWSVIERSVGAVERT